MGMSRVRLSYGESGRAAGQPTCSLRSFDWTRFWRVAGLANLAAETLWLRDYLRV